MIKDPPVLTIRRTFERPGAAELAALAGIPTGFVVDTMGGRGGLDYRIKPMIPLAGPVLGVAVTCDCGPADNLALFGALAISGPGDVLVAATDGFTATAVTGDLLLGMAKNRGVAAFVTDGLIRDLVGIRAVGLPTFAAGLTPNSPARSGPGTVGLPIVVGGVPVASGDIIVGDEDGVVVIPRRRAGEVIARLEAVKAAEASLDAKVKAGLTLPDFVQAMLDSDRVVELE
ncbi:MAG: RraA family protein [Rhizobiales bacterium]|nr:RraA family protein [Hyphomicrobiales bacterium]